MTPPGFDVALDARRPDGGAVELLATGVVPQVGPREIVLHRARFDLDDAEWTLVQPATFRWAGDEVVVDELVLEDVAGEGAPGGCRPRPAARGCRRPRGVSPPCPPATCSGSPASRSACRAALGRCRHPRRGGDPLVDITFRIEQGAIADVPLLLLEGRALREPGDAARRGGHGGHHRPRGRAGAPAVAAAARSGPGLRARSTACRWRGRCAPSSLAGTPSPPSSLRCGTHVGLVTAQVNLGGTAERRGRRRSMTLVDGAMTVGRWTSATRR
jgi:hypothetical protein